MHVPHLAAAVSALPLAALLLLGPAGQAQALECGPGLAPAVVNGAEVCAPTQYSPGDAVPSYNPGESYYNPETGEYHEAVPAVPIPAEPSAAPTPVPATAAPAPTTAPAPAPAPAGGQDVAPAPAATPSPSATKSSTPTPSPKAAETERTSLALPAIAAVVILGLLAGTLLLRHRNRRTRS